jgi:hypothetical protein
MSQGAGSPGVAGVTLSPDRGAEGADLLQSPGLRRFGRFFDVATALTGLVVLVFLGPVMLCQALTARIPLKRELSPIEGVALACNPDIRGALVRIAGYQHDFRSQLDSCSKLSLRAPGRAVVVSLYVSPAQMNAMRGRDAVPSFGLAIDGETLHELEADLSAARLDRVVLTITGIIATAALAWLAWALASDPAAARRIFPSSNG